MIMMTHSNLGEHNLKAANTDMVTEGVSSRDSLMQMRKSRLPSLCQRPMMKFCSHLYKKKLGSRISVDEEETNEVRNAIRRFTNMCFV